jgi:hypothetical protein
LARAHPLIPCANQIQLPLLLEDVRAGKLVIPDFQRDFVWTRKQIEELINSIINRYFIGTILLLESPTFNLRFAPRIVRGVEADPKKHASIKYVLDGQQRITSLYYAFNEPNLPLRDDSLPTRFYLNLNTCQEVVGVESVDDLLRRLYPDKEARKMLKKFSELLSQSTGIDIERYPTMGRFGSPEALDRYLTSQATGLQSETRDELNRLLQSVLDYEVAVVTLPYDTPDDEIVSTFERINRLGTRLDIFDLAVARYYPLGIRLNELKKKLEAGSNSKEFLEYLDPDAILKEMALAKGMEPKNKNLLGLVDVKGERSKAQAEFYSRWEAAVQYLQKAILRMRNVYGAERIRAKKNRIPLIPYTSMAVPLACVIQQADSHGSTKALYDKIDLWYWTAVLTGRYARSSETQAYADFKAMVSWLDDDEAKIDIAADVSNVISEMRKASRTSALAKAFYNLLILNGSKDFITGQPVKLEDCEVDHVFPVSKYPSSAKNIFGLSVIHKETNRKKSGKLPSEFLKTCLESHGGDKSSLLATLRSHFISSDGFEAMEQNDLDAFLAAREAAFQKAVEGKVLKR